MLIFSLIFFLFNSLQASIEVKYVNQRFMWIEAPANLVKARLSHPKDGNSICWIEVLGQKDSFYFVTRRALPYKTCLHHVLEIRELLSQNNRVQIIGNGAVRDDKKNSYSSSWEIIRTSNKCIGYFGGCEDFEKVHPEWNDWKGKGIDSNIYP